MYTAGAASATAPPPLVVDMHGLMGCAYHMWRFSGWREAADAHGFVVAWPQSSQALAGHAEQFSSWNAGRCCSSASAARVDDVGFLRKMTLATIAAHNVDPARVYFAGHSNGCMMAQKMALEASDLVAAVCCHAGYLMQAPDADAFPARPPGYSPVAVMTIQGAADTVVPWARAWSGGSVGADDVWWPGAPHNLAMWAKLNGCDGSASAEWHGEGPGRYRLHAHTACANGTQAKLMEVPAVGHMPYRFETGVEIDTTAACWDFVSAFTRGLHTPHAQHAHARARARAHAHVHANGV